MASATRTPQPQELRPFKEPRHNGVSFDGPVPDCDMCAVGKSYQLAHPKTTDHKVNLSFQLIFVDMMGPITSEPLGGYKYITKISDEYTKSTRN